MIRRQVIEHDDASAAWRSVLNRAGQIAEGRQAIRLTNLALAASRADADRRPDGARLHDHVLQLTIAGPLAAYGDAADWQSLAEEASRTAARFSEDDGHDRWVQAFQSEDRARKSRGAYATPLAVARPMANLLLRGRDTPERVLDPSAGGGTLLLACLNQMMRQRRTKNAAASVLTLFGVELDPVARELCCLQLWLASGASLAIATIAAQIRQDNAITRDWAQDGPYDALIMNPPWDSLRHTADADGDERLRTIERLAGTTSPSDGLPPLFSNQGRGDRNLYKAFLEIAPHVVRPGARIVALIPGAWSSDLGTRELRDFYMRHTEIEQWTSLENRRGYFPIDGRYKFGILAARRSSAGTTVLRTLGMADDIRRLAGPHVHVPVQALNVIGGRPRLIPDLVDEREAELLTKIRINGRAFFDPHPQLGVVHYDREVDLTEGRKRALFHRLEDLDVRRSGHATWTSSDGRLLVPLLEGRMVGRYDFMEKSWVSGRGRSAIWRYNNGGPLEECQPQFLAPPSQSLRNRIAICDVTSATNTRTVLAAWVPDSWQCGNTAPVLVFEHLEQAMIALAILNSMVFDWQARRIVAGLHLNKFYLEALSWPDLDEAQSDTLIESVSALLSLQPRYRAIGPPLASSAHDYITAHQRIERIVASGFGLELSDLPVLFDPSTDSRRGFWRHYVADPSARLIADACCAQVAVT